MTFKDSACKLDINCAPPSFKKLLLLELCGISYYVPIMDRKFLWGFVLIPLAIVAVIDNLRNDPPQLRETAPTLTLGLFKICATNIAISRRQLGEAYKPKSCRTIKGIAPVFFKDSEILYEGNKVIAIRGQSIDDEKWYQVDTRDDRYIRVVPVNR
jgi:hypothetical protein